MGSPAHFCSNLQVIYQNALRPEGQRGVRVVKLSAILEATLHLMTASRNLGQQAFITFLSIIESSFVYNLNERMNEMIDE